MWGRIEGLVELLPEGAHEAIAGLVTSSRRAFALAVHCDVHWVDALVDRLPALLSDAHVLLLKALAEPHAAVSFLASAAPIVSRGLDLLLQWSPSPEQVDHWLDQGLEQASRVLVRAASEDGPTSRIAETLLDGLERLVEALAELSLREA